MKRIAKQTSEERREKARIRMAQLRLNPEYRQKEREREALRKATLRKNAETRQQEQEADTSRRRQRREDSEIRQQEQEADTSRRRKRREDSEIRQQEQEADTSRRRQRRGDSEIRQQEQEADTSRRRKRREDSEIRQQEQEADTSRRRQRREDSEIRQQEQEANTSRRRKRREDSEIRQQEQEADTSRRRQRREDSEIRQQEQEANTSRRRKRREDSKTRQQEQDANTSSRRKRREDSELRQQEQNANTVLRRHHRSELAEFTDKIEVFKENIKDGPVHPCFCCDRIFFKTSIKPTTRDELAKKGCSYEFIDQIVLEEFKEETLYFFCTTCFRDISGKKKKHPRFCIQTSWLKFKEIPEVLKDITALEERCISPRILFMKIYALSYDRQFGIRGGVVNVPVDVPKMFSSIPIRPEQTGTIQLKLKRRMGDKHHYKYETIRPEKIWNAASFLVETELYRDVEKISLNQQWNGQLIATFNVNPENLDEDSSNIELETNTTSGTPPNENDVVENEEESFPDDAPEETYEETMLDSLQGVEFAPGEGEIPQSILLDKYCEELAFPTIYCGQPRNPNPAAKLSYEDITNSELRRRDRRAVRPDHLLFVNKKSQCKQLGNSINIALKKTQTFGMTASQALDKTFMNDIISKDNAYRFLTNITGSPPYWEQQKKNVLAMVRQLGIFTFFITLSAAETHWPELLKVLKKTVDNEDDADVSVLDFQEKARLIRSDPVTCALYFDHRFKELKKTWTKVKNGPFGEYKVSQIYYRIEFQHRGSPHAHLLVWLENAPKFDPNDETSYERVTEFIDSIVTTSSENSLIEDLNTFQFHKCTFTCKKYAGGKATCRFNAPFAPMDRTRILKPLPDDFPMTPEKAKEFRELNKRIKELLSGEALGNITDFKEMLVILNCSMDEYLLALRSQLSAAKVFLKRQPKDCRINPYSPKILSLMRSNMDIQFVLDPYGCIGYIVDYINKPSRGLSRLLRNCVESFKKGNFSLRQRLKSVANTFYNGTEVSAQEAAWCRLRLPMSFSTVGVEFINTLPKKERQRILKSDSDIAKLDPNSEDIVKHGHIDRYSDRPEELENISLAEFVSDYTYHCKGRKSSDDLEERQENHEVEDTDEPDTSNGSKLKMKRGIGYLVKRKQRKVIRFCRFDVRKDPVNFFREMVMLFKPWRDEIKEVEEVNCEDICKTFKNLIETKFKLYTTTDINFNEILSELERQRELADSLENEEEYDRDEVDSTMVAYDFQDGIVQPNIMIDIGQESAGGSDNIKTFTIPDQLSDKEYFELVDSLNLEQRDYLMHLISEMKGNAESFYHFISGGAGVGKSRLIQAIYQSVIRIYRQMPGPVETNEVVLIAPTGKAAHNIGGMTAHSAFSLEVSQNQMTSKDLTAETLNTLQVKLHNLKLLIIDEISMMGSNQFSSIHRRMRQIFRSDKPFGGKSVIVFGDFNQLRPVGDSYVFMPRRDPLASLVGNCLWQNFLLFELIKIMRQKDDLKFAEALGRLAKGILTADDIIMLNGRCFKDHQSLPENAKSAIHLFKTKVEVDEYNMKRVQELTKPDCGKIVYKAIDKVIGAANQRDSTQALHALQNLPTELTYGLPATLILQKEVRYMVTSNINISDGLFNGASGVLKFIELSNQGPHAVWIQFDDSTVGALARGDRKNIAEMMKLPANLTPIQRMKKVFKPTKTGQAQICREQYPLVVAEGITIHKSQGQSMEQVVVGLAKSMDRSLLYVALSRATTLCGLYMIGEFRAPNKPPENHLPTAEMERLRKYATLYPKFGQLHKADGKGVQIVSHNVQSLRKHLSSIICDPVYTASHLLLFQETWILTQEKVLVPHFKEVQRNMISGRPAAKGTIIFAKDSLIITAGSSVSKESGAMHIEITSCIMDSIRIVNIYKNPKSTLEFLKMTLQENRMLFNHDNVLLCGDFNNDFGKTNSVENFLNTEFGLKFLSPRLATTNEKTTIDAVFGKLRDYSIHITIYESLFSYHKPLLIRLYNKNLNL